MCRSHFTSALSFLFMLNAAHCAQSEMLDLGGDWLLRNQNGSVHTKAYVPGYVHTALLKSGHIGDPYFRYNDKLYRWIDYDNWTYSRSFNVEESWLNKTTVALVCEGLDTIAEVIINGVQIGISTNMFRSYTWDVRKALTSGTNEIKIAFTSAVTYSASKSKQYPYPIPPACPPPVQQGECHVNVIRKKQCSFSWDWGPAFASQGIWKNISIQAFNSLCVKNVLIKTQKENDDEASWLLHVDVIVNCGLKQSSGTIIAKLSELGVTSKTTILCPHSGTFQVKLPTMVFEDQHQVKTWWPRGYGSQPLYSLVVDFTSKDLSEVSTKIVRIGFREVQLVQQKLPGGLSFFYKVNNVPIFLKGANWIPADSFEDRVSDEVIRNILQSAADANMNVVRNWGGGIYQHDSFYNIADELGLMIWQEFMFACDYYPADSEFLDSVEKEVEDQIQRLQYHPSILVWSGNNEIESSVSQNWYGVKNISIYKEDYIKLFINTVKRTVTRVDASRPFVSSSPSDGLDSEKQGWIASDPNSDFYGDVHYYNYTMDCWDVRGYPQPRFASEYGLQSMPDFHTLSTVTEEEDWSFSSPLMIHRQHHGGGNEQMSSEIRMHFNLPNSKNSLKKFKDMLYLTQVSQALCIQAESEHYRRLRGRVTDEGRGYTMGTIYWQLNSIWPAPTWSSLEYGGRWKMLHYYAKVFFLPLIVSPFELNNTLYVFVVSDLQEAVIVHLEITVWSWQKMKPLRKLNNKIRVEKQSSVQAYQENIEKLLNSSSCEDRTKCVATLSATNGVGLAESPTNVFYFSPFQNVQLLNPQLKIIEVTMVNESFFGITIHSEAIAPFVWLTSGKILGRFSHNGFLITQTITKISFYAWTSVTVKDLHQSLEVSSLYNVYAK